MKIGKRITTATFYNNVVLHRIRENIRKRTQEEKNRDYPRRLQLVTSGPVRIKKGRPGFLKSTPFVTRRKYFRSEQARRKQLISTRPTFLSAITMREFQKFLGILLFASEKQLPDLKGYWRRAVGKTGYPEIQQALSYERFALIYRCFHFTDEEVGQIPFFQKQYLM
jgi:hypothetical protein